MPEVTSADRGGDTLRAYVQENGYKLPAFRYSPGDDTMKRIWEELPDFECREDDVLLCSFPKTGTNWLFQVITMILQGSTAPISLEKSKMSTFLEAMPKEKIEPLSSPRVLNTHIHYRYLPKQIKTKGIRTVLIMRNPKDTSVSFYNHCRAIKLYEYAGKWENWLPYYLNGEHEYGTYESYLQEWESVMDDPGFPLHVMYYEDLKEDGVNEVKRLAKFLGIVDDKLCEEIESKSQFKNMKDLIPPAVKKMALTENSEFYRKGEVGDWKNWFTVSQNEQFDQLWHERMKTSQLKFRYVPKNQSI